MGRSIRRRPWCGSEASSEFFHRQASAPELGHDRSSPRSRDVGVVGFVRGQDPEQVGTFGVTAVLDAAEFLVQVA